MHWKPLLAYLTGAVDQELLLRNEYLVTENRLLRNQIPGRVRLTDAERKTLAEIGKKLGKQALEDIATVVKPDTILAWHRKLVAQKFDGSVQRKAPGRPPIDAELESLVVRIAKENRAWGYDRIAGALAHLGYPIRDQTVGNILDRDGKYCPAFQHTIDAADVTRVPLPPRSPNLNAYAERWIRSIKEEALSRLILFGERALWHALTEYVTHFHEECLHQGKGNVVLMPPLHHHAEWQGPIRCRERLGGLLKSYSQEAA